MELDLSKYPLQELYKRFEEVEQKEANVSKFENYKILKDLALTIWKV